MTLSFVKLSIYSFMHHLSPRTFHQRIIEVIRAIDVLWLVSSTLTALFQCAVPKPWDYIDGFRCIDRRAWWTYVSVFNMGTEFGIIVLYFLIIGNLQISLSKKVKLLSIFSARILVMAAIATQLAVFWDEYPSSDITNSLWLPIVCNQVVVCLSVITACLPYLKPLMESLESGLVRANIPEEFSQELSLYQRTY
ncbi:hypothetical protein BGZ60DRAFT_533488 [Tricladium varicosporioides]|nr:hypothetical protein BGZ60DRAFT_533488 [Hymenoscyphus varicosporioides]